MASLSDVELDQWRARGVSGFVCKIPYLRGLGGANDFTADPGVSLAGPTYTLQRQLRDTRIVARAAARGIRLWLGVGLGNYYDSRTPLAEWFDDSKWSNTVVPKMKEFAGAARALGFAGIAFDEEPYPGSSGQEATWEWQYQGNTHSEAQVRAMVRNRGEQLMRAIVGASPGVNILDYWTYFPESWEELVREKINNIPDAEANKVQVNFWDGMTSVEGYGSVTFLDAIFYKTVHLGGASWDTALQYDANRTLAYLSRHLSNWAYASTRIAVTPFAWIDAGPNPGFEAARPPADVERQLSAFRRWGMGGLFANYAYADPRKFDYSPYVPALLAAAAPGVVDSSAPAIAMGSVVRSGPWAILTGSARDDMGVRSVRWSTATGDRGAAPMVWTVESGDYKVGYRWRMEWSARVPAAPGEPITLTVEDLKGNQTITTVSG